MKQYKIKESALKKKKLYYLIFAPIGGIAFSFLFTYYGPMDAKFAGSLPFAITMGIIISVVVIITSRLNIFEQSYLLTLSDTHIIVKDKLGTETKIPNNEITEIFTNSNKDISIKGIPVNQIATIPKDIEEYDEIYVKLNVIKPISVNSDEPFNLKYSIPLGIIRAVLFLAALFSPNKFLAYCALGVMILLTLWNIVEMQRSKKVDDNTKVLNYLSIASILYLLVHMLGK